MKIEHQDFNDLTDVITKNIEKSDLNRYYLFTTDTIEKSKIFVSCYRILQNVFNIIEEGKLKGEIKKELENVEEKSKRINFLLNTYHEDLYGSSKIKMELFSLINSKESTELIDFFSMFTEKENIMKVSRLKGIYLEGKSGRKFKEVMEFKEV